MKKIFAVCILTLSFISMTPAKAQQISERAPYDFKVVGSPIALSRAIAIERAEDGFGTQQNIESTVTTNSSTSVGTLTEVQAILEGDNSNLDLSSDNTPSNSGTQTSTSDQTN